MNSKCQFSVLLPVRNGGSYFKECVHSILAQSYRNFELIVLDNASTDGSISWLQELSDPRIRLIVSTKPLSIEENWSRILGVKKNDYMTITGHDDLFDVDYLAVMHKLIMRYPDASLYQAHFRIIDGNGKKRRLCMRMPEIEKSHEFLKSRLLLRRDSFGTGYVFKSSDYDKVGGIPQYTKLMFSDDALWLKLMEISFKATTKEVCFSYREHKASTSGSPDWQSTYSALNSYLDLLRQLAQENREIEIMLSEYLKDYMIFWYQWAYMNARTANDKTEVERDIWSLVSKVHSILKIKDKKDENRIITKIRKRVFSHIAYVYWISQRIKIWARRRL